eukprot:snap_masked-scaffold_1-processed-gene-16.53-mRNA-1 protein AED:1.00 eAED:1.00 QI:0/-1/0/0/-1/1/1/0/273
MQTLQPRDELLDSFADLFLPEPLIKSEAVGLLGETGKPDISLFQNLLQPLQTTNTGIMFHSLATPKGSFHSPHSRRTQSLDFFPRSTNFFPSAPQLNNDLLKTSGSLEKLKYSNMFHSSDNLDATRLEVLGRRRKSVEVSSSVLLEPELKKLREGMSFEHERVNRSLHKTRQKRLKWSDDDLLALWKSISEHGNEWKEVAKAVTSRSYHQVKDKGRRLLRAEQWSTGKTKRDSRDARGVAMSIASEVIGRYNKTGSFENKSTQNKQMYILGEQ